MSEPTGIPWQETIIGTLAALTASVGTYWLTGRGGQRPRIEEEAKVFAFSALQQVAEVRGEEIARLEARVDELADEVADCNRRHALAERALVEAGITIPKEGVSP